MSLDAMTWGRKQRGLKPPVRIVLWALTDRHNPDLKYCYPDQDLLAYECEISRASLNRHLLELEEKGLVKRVAMKDPNTGMQLNTRYYLSFDTDLAALDVVVRVSNCDTDFRVSKTSKSVSHSSETLITSKITSKKPLTPEELGKPGPQDVVSAHVHAVVDEDLFRQCCALTGHAVSGIDRRGGWYFTNDIIEQANAGLAGVSQ